MLSNPAIATLVSIFAGGLITWLAAWIYYKRAGDEFRAETALLRKANMVVAYMLEHPDAEVEVHRDEAGKPIGLVVSATAHASGKATVKGIGAEAKKDS
jgi:hypothetical protein